MLSYYSNYWDKTRIDSFVNKQSLKIIFNTELKEQSHFNNEIITNLKITA